MSSITIHSNQTAPQQEDPASAADYTEFENLIAGTVDSYIERQKSRLDPLIYNAMKAELKATKALLLREMGLLKSCKCCASDFHDRASKGMERISRIADTAIRDNADFKKLTQQKTQALADSTLRCGQCHKDDPTDLVPFTFVTETNYKFPNGPELKQCVRNGKLPRSNKEYAELGVLDDIAHAFGGKEFYTDDAIHARMVQIANDNLPPAKDRLAAIRETAALVDAVQGCAKKETRRVPIPIGENSPNAHLVPHLTFKNRKGDQVTMDDRGNLVVNGDGHTVVSGEGNVVVKNNQ